MINVTLTQFNYKKYVLFDKCKFTRAYFLAFYFGAGVTHLSHTSEVCGSNP